MTVDLGPNPHGVLGAHESKNGVVVRTLVHIIGELNTQDHRDGS